MDSEKKQENITVKAIPENVPVLRKFVERCCRRWNIPEDTSFALAFAVDEVCSNIVTHGSGDTDRGKIELKFYRLKNRTKITITDNTELFNPFDAPEPDINEPWQTRNTGGLGLHLTKKLMDEVHYRSEAETFNHLTLVKYLK